MVRSYTIPIVDGPSLQELADQFAACARIAPEGEPLPPESCPTFRLTVIGPMSERYRIAVHVQTLRRTLAVERSRVMEGFIDEAALLLYPWLKPVRQFGAFYYTERDDRREGLLLKREPVG